MGLKAKKILQAMLYCSALLYCCALIACKARISSADRDKKKSLKEPLKVNMSAQNMQVAPQLKVYLLVNKPVLNLTNEHQEDFTDSDAFSPTATLFVPVELIDKASLPTAVLEAPVVLFLKECLPTAVLLDAVVLECRASLPIAVLLAPVVLSANA